MITPWTRIKKNRKSAKGPKKTLRGTLISAAVTFEIRMTGTQTDVTCQHEA
jgi:hypothetical protein